MVASSSPQSMILQLGQDTAGDVFRGSCPVEPAPAPSLEAEGLPCLPLLVAATDAIASPAKRDASPRPAMPRASIRPLPWSQATALGQDASHRSASPKEEACEIDLDELVEEKEESVFHFSD